ncbi:MAG: chromate transporter [Butyricicoccus sp.]|nr:chromate transporter [Butyricicoccus sp.]
MRYIHLYLAFLRLGAFTFGGGLAMLPLLRQEAIDRYHWVTEEELIDMYAVAQCTPGIIAVNTSVYVGYRVAGIGGVFAAVLGQVTSPMCVMTILAMLFHNHMDTGTFQHALAGIGAMVCVLLTNTVWTMGKKCIRDRFTAILGVCAFALGMAFDLPILLLTLCGGTVAVLYAALTGRWRG